MQEEASGEPGHRTYDTLRASIRAHVERRVEEASRNERRSWQHALALLDAFHALGPWPEPYRIDKAAASTNPAGELARADASMKALEDYYERASALGIDL
jgi:hypothetical protein